MVLEKKLKGGSCSSSPFIRAVSSESQEACIAFGSALTPNWGKYNHLISSYFNWLLALLFELYSSTSVDWSKNLTVLFKSFKRESALS